MTAQRDTGPQLGVKGSAIRRPQRWPALSAVAWEHEDREDLALPQCDMTSRLQDSGRVREVCRVEVLHDDRHADARPAANTEPNTSAVDLLLFGCRAGVHLAPAPQLVANRNHRACRLLCRMGGVHHPVSKENSRNSNNVHARGKGSSQATGRQKASENAVENLPERCMPGCSRNRFQSWSGTHPRRCILDFRFRCVLVGVGSEELALKQVTPHVSSHRDASGPWAMFSRPT